MPDPKSRVRQMSPVEAASVAWLLEGEGSFTLGKHKERVLIPHIGFGTTTYDTLEAIKEMVGFSGISSDYESKGFGSKPFRYWYIAARADCKALLPQIIPHLVHKKWPAQLIYAALLAHEDGKPATDFEWACYWAIRDYNTKGMKKARENFLKSYEKARQKFLRD